MANRYSPTQAARRLDVSTATIRRFADTFAELLPDYGEIDEGMRREFTEADLRHLWAIIQLMNEQPQGTSRQDLLDRLRDPKAPPLVVPAVLPLPTEGLVAPEPVEKELKATGEPQPSPLAIQATRPDPDLNQMVSSLITAQSTLVEAQSQQVPDLISRLEELTRENREMRRQLADMRGNRFSIFYATAWFGWGVLITIGAIGLALWLMSGPDLSWLPF
jgi:DNA-binding transcriptional MerR regulator